MVYLLNSIDITNQQFQVNGITYPYNWCKLATNGELASLGIIVLSIVFPTLSEGQIYDGTYVDNIPSLTRTYNVVNFTPPVISDYEFTRTGEFTMEDVFAENTLIQNIAIRPNDHNENLCIGLPEALGCYVPANDYIVGEWSVIAVNMMRPDILYFYGATGSVTYKIYIK